MAHTKKVSRSPAGSFMRSEVLVGAIVLALALPHCMASTDGIEVDVAYEAAAMPQAVLTDMGYRVKLDRALIALGQVELLECDNSARQLWRLFVPGRARAHEESTPTSLGIPMIIDLMESSGEALFAGTLRPPPGRYCGIRVVGAPADADAIGAWWEDRRNIIQPSELLIDSDGKITVSSYSDGPLGRMDATDVVKLVAFYESRKNQ